MKNSITKVFEYKGLEITREEYEGLPCSMAALLVSDEVMTKIIKEIYDNLLMNWSADEIQKYLCATADFKTDVEEAEDETADMIRDEYWRVMENVAIENGMKYYEDLP